MTEELLVRPHDQVVVRDGRPFGDGQANRMRTLPWPTPQMFAGSLRSWLGKHAGGFSRDQIERLLQIGVRGPLPVSNGCLFFPVPSDFVYRVSPPQVFRSRPGRMDRGGVTLPDGASQLCFLTPTSEEEFKPAPPPPFVSLAWMTQWLLDRAEVSAPAAADTLEKLPVDERTHVAIDPDAYSAAEHLLFTTAGLSFPGNVAISARIDASSLGMSELPSDRLHPLGGERRVAMWSSASVSAKGWECPEGLVQRLSDTNVVRLVLATPGLFERGWLPGWLTRGDPVPGTGVRLEFVGATCGRWQPISGWNLKVGEEFGPKAVRRLVPAGAVYFCKVLKGSVSELASRWLQPVADSAQDRNDGYALALWGVWSEHHG